MRKKLPPTSPETYRRARATAQELRLPVYVFGDDVTTSRPPRTTAMVWPNGSVTWGNAMASDRPERRRRAA